MPQALPPAGATGAVSRGRRRFLHDLLLAAGPAGLVALAFWLLPVAAGAALAAGFGLLALAWVRQSARATASGADGSRTDGAGARISGVLHGFAALALTLAALITLAPVLPAQAALLPVIYLAAGGVVAAMPLDPLRTLPVSRPLLWFAAAGALAAGEAAGGDRLTGAMGLVLAGVLGLGWALGNRALRLALDTAARERREALAARETADRRLSEKDRFFAVVSHELRTPLNAILGMAQSLATADLPEEDREKARVIADAGRTLTALLGDVLDLSKLEAAQLAISPAPESFHATLHHVLTLYRPLAEEKGIALDLEIAPQVPDWLEHDAVRVRQCLSNLVSNAIKFTERGGVCVTVGARLVAEVPERRQRLTVSVRDTGIGMSEAARERLFEPFAQADGSISGRFGGTGLGLHIARRLARRMGGDIRCDSRPAGGSVFTFVFEGAEATRPVPAATPAELGASTPGLTVLVADDVPTNRMVMRLLLAPMGIGVIEAADGAEACRLLRARKADAALLDLRMPRLSGTELVSMIRQGRAGDPELPVLAVTADDSVRAEAMRLAGFDGLVHKPLDQRALQTAVVTTLAARLVGRSCRGGAA